MYPGNFYNPYGFSHSLPTLQNYGGISSASKASGLLGKSFLKGISWDGFLTSAGKTLNVINQAIPIFYQVKPIFHNAKTMFRVLGAVRQSDNSSPSNFSKTIQKSNVNLTDNSNVNSFSSIPTNENLYLEDGNPTFFL
ncbi:MAG: hypothetical protein E7168_03320 [Firmicutes bacterium]|nr:hypothetical protein [Bacillota bacterium]